jgi:gliding motility-associated-like protein
MYFFFCGADLKNIEWFIDGEKIAETKTFNHTFETEGSYEVSLQSVLPNGQQDKKTITLEVVKPVEFNIPNVFTPGKDGLNDTFDIAEAIENEKEILRLIIQNRAGKIVFDSDNHFVWNGRDSSGEVCEAGVYTYSVLLTDKKNKSQTKSGTIQLFRE